MVIHRLIAAINPDVYCHPRCRKEVKRVLKEAFQRGDRTAYLQATEHAEPVEPNPVPLTELELMNPFQLPGFRRPTTRHRLTYDSMEDSLEAFYFGLLDGLEEDGWDVSKLVDTFQASPGSGLFAELSRRQGRMQQEALRLWRDAQGLVSFLLRAVQDIRSTHETPGGDTLSFRPVPDRELLRSKLDLLRLYAHWLGPYLRHARELDPKAHGGSSLVSLFNTAVAEVTLLASREYDLKTVVDQGDLPRLFLKSKHRLCREVILLELRFRAAPERTDADSYAYRGRVELTMTSYALNDDEIALLQEELDRKDLDLLIRPAGKAGAPLDAAIAEIERVLDPPPLAKSDLSNANPFSALFNFRSTFGDNQAEPDNETGCRILPKDSDIEKVIRSQAILKAQRRCTKVYNGCKQTLSMSQRARTAE